MVVAGIVLMLGGCRVSRNVAVEGPTTGFPNHTLEEIRTQLLQHHTSSVEAYEAETALSVRSPIQSGSFSAEIQHRHADSLLISFSPGFGIVAVRALVTPDSVFVYDRINKELIFGSVSNLSHLLPLPSSSNALYESMLGLLLPDTSKQWALSISGSYYVLTSSDGREVYTIDPTYWRIVRFEERGAGGDLIEERTFSEFRRYTDIYLPRRLTFRRPEEDTAASLYYRKLTLNPPALTFDFPVGNDVRRVRFD